MLIAVMHLHRGPGRPVPDRQGRSRRRFRRELPGAFPGRLGHRRRVEGRGRQPVQQARPRDPAPPQPRPSATAATMRPLRAVHRTGIYCPAHRLLRMLSVAVRVMGPRNSPRARTYSGQRRPGQRSRACKLAGVESFRPRHGKSSAPVTGDPECITYVRVSSRYARFIENRGFGFALSQLIWLFWSYARTSLGQLNIQHIMSKTRSRDIWSAPALARTDSSSRTSSRSLMSWHRRSCHHELSGLGRPSTSSRGCRRRG